MKNPQATRAPTGSGKRRAVKAFAAVILALVVGAGVVVYFPEILLNPFLEARVSQKYEDAFPGNTVRMKGISYDFWANAVECDSVSIGVPDSAPVITAGRISVSGMSRLTLLLGRGLTPDVLAGVLVDAGDVILRVPGWIHEIRFHRLEMSARDSSLTIDSLQYRPPGGDGEFFAGSEFRRTRYLLVASRGLAAGLDVPLMMLGNGYRVRSIQFADVSLSVLINKEKPEDAGAPAPQMPEEILAAFGVPLRIDTVSLEGGRLRYEEQFDTDSSPAILTCDGIQLAAAGISDPAGGGDTMTITGRGILMSGGEITVRMSVPVGSPDLSFRYSGRLGPMELSDFNPFIERSEHLRIKTGILHATDFDVNVTAGTARGDVRLQYTDLKIIAINDHTGSESGVGNTVISLIANNIMLRTSNMPDQSGAAKLGTVNYRREPDDAFLEFAWLSVKSGIGDLVGF